MKVFRLLALRRLRQAPLRSATTVLSIGAGVALAVSITILLASIDRSLTDFGRGIAGPAPLRITGATLEGGLPLSAVDTAAGVEGVEAVVPMVQTVARTQPEPGGPLTPVLVLGVDCRVEALVGSIGCEPDRMAADIRPLAAGPRTVTGAEAVLRTADEPLPIGEVPVVDSLSEIGDGRALVLPLPLAQERFLRPGQVDIAYVLTEPGADVGDVRAALQDAVGDHLPVRAAADPPAAADAVLGAALPIYSLLGVFALGVGAVLVANTAAMVLESRRRELAVLGALGGRRATVLTAAIAEMALLGAAGGALGTLGGLAVASPIVASFSGFTEEIIGAPLRTHVPASALVTGVLLGVLLGGGAALLPARRATRLDVAAELSGRERGDATRPPRLPRRVAIWTTLAAFGALGCWAAQRDGGLRPWQSAVATPSFLVTVLSLLFANVAAVPLLVGHGARLAARTASAPLRLALHSARRDHRRTGLLAVTVGAAVVTAFVTEGSSASARRSIEASLSAAGQGVEISTVPFDDGAAPAVSESLAFALGGVPGVATVHRGTMAITGMADEPVLVRAVTGNRLTTAVIDGEASADRLAAGEVIIGPGLARAQRIGAGDEVRVVTPIGEVALPVQAVWEDGANVGRNITMAPEHLRELFGPRPTAFVSVSPVEGVSEAELADRVEAAGLHPELRTRSSMETADAIADEVDEQFGSFRVMQQALLVVLFAAVLSSLLLAAVQRRRELGLLGAVGADPAALARLLLTEAGVVAIAGVAMSALMGPIIMFALNEVLPFVVGFRNPLTFAWPVLVSSGALAVLVTLAGAAWPARRAARVEVLEALRYE